MRMVGRRIPDALDVITRTDLDGAIVDLNLRGKAAFPVADALADRHIPFVFATGYLVAGHIPARHGDVRRFVRPTAPSVICRALAERWTKHLIEAQIKGGGPQAAP